MFFSLVLIRIEIWTKEGWMTDQAGEMGGSGQDEGLVGALSMHFQNLGNFRVFPHLIHL